VAAAIMALLTSALSGTMMDLLLWDRPER